MGNFFSTNLKFIREQKGLSQNKLANMVGVNQTTIARWEAQEIVPSIDNVEDVANVLNISLPDILTIDLRLQNTIHTTTFKKDGMEITLGKNGNITNDDLDEAMAFILEQKLKQKNNEKNNN